MAYLDFNAHDSWWTNLILDEVRHTVSAHSQCNDVTLPETKNKSYISLIVLINANVNSIKLAVLEVYNVHYQSK